MIPNGFQSSKNVPKRSKNVRKHDFRTKMSDPKIDFRPSVGLGKEPTRIFGQFRRHDFSSFFHDCLPHFSSIFSAYQGYIRDISPSLLSPKRGDYGISHKPLLEGFLNCAGEHVGITWWENRFPRILWQVPVPAFHAHGGAHT